VLAVLLADRLLRLDRQQPDRHRGRHLVAHPQRLREVQPGVQEDHVHPGATREARWASTPSAIELVTQNRGPNCSTAHSMTASAGAPSNVGCAA
jgi:hypothetical protein